MRWKVLLFALVLAGGIGLGMVPWPVTQPVNWWLRHCVDERSSWDLSIAEARWVPLRNRLELLDLKLQVPGGGRVHLARVFATTHPLSLARGFLEAHCQLREGRIDPGSWGIRRAPVVELLSAGPVADEGTAVLQIGLNKILFQTLTLSGPLLRVQAEGWFLGGDRGHLNMKGSLARKLLEQMNLVNPEDPAASLWEPFQFSLDGALAHPDVSFASHFLSISFKNQGEHKP